MAASPKSTVVLKNKFNSRGIHTQYVGDSSLGHADAGHAKRMLVQPFFRGRGNVDGPIRQALKDHGVIK